MPPHTSFKSTVKWFLATLFLATLLGCPIVQAAERILDYNVSAVLEKDASLLVTEHITVNAEHDKIKHGITQTYPVRKAIDHQTIQKASFEVVSITVDGQPATYTLNHGYFMDSIAIGDEKKSLSIGRHTYTIVYRTHGHVHFMEDYDGIDFNAIGLDSPLPIDHASFSLTLPEGVNPLMAKAFTGPEGSQDNNCQQTTPTAFKTTRPLPPNAGLTVAIGWEKGWLTPPETTFSDWLNQHRPLALLGLLGSLCLYLLGCWFFLYRKPKKPVIPLFSPPEGLTPGLVAWMKDKTFTPVMLQADLIWLAVNGFAKMNLSDTDNVQFIQQAAPVTKGNWITRACHAICRSFYQTDRVILLGRDGNHPSRSLSNAWEVVRKWYKGMVSPLTEHAFLPGLVGLLIWGYGFYRLLDHIYQPGFANKMAPIDTIMLPGFYFGFAVYMVYSAIQGRKGTRYRSTWHRIIKPAIKWGAAILATASGTYLLDFDWLFIITFLGIALLPILFIQAFSTPLTEAGQKTADQIEGLRLYITTTEAERLAAINAPDDTVEKYEELLPYAIALGCANTWQQRFESLFEQLDYRPGWTMTTDILTAAAYRNIVFNSLITESPAVNAIHSAIAESESSRSGASGKSGSNGGSGSGSGSRGAKGR